MFRKKAKKSNAKTRHETGETGETGKVIGIDFTPAMLQRGRQNAEIRGFNNAEFRQGDIEKMPVTANVANVIVSNCVLNLVPNKDGVFKEIFRALKPGGHFSISDIVLEGRAAEANKRSCRNVCRLCSWCYSKEGLFGTHRKQ